MVYLVRHHQVSLVFAFIIAGDLCILNALFITLYYVLDTDTQRILLSDSLPQLLVLLNLVYLLCNYSKESCFTAASYVQTIS